VRLHKLPLRKNRKFRAKRVGRGYGSGVGGHTVGKGQKGQKSRSGNSKGVGFEGGNVPLFRRLPKFRGFRNPTRVEYQPINFADIEKNFTDGDVVSLSSLRKKGMVRKNVKRVKILGKGTLTKKVTFKSVEMSSTARERFEKNSIST